MNEEQILKLNAYIMEVCHEYEHCNTCPFNHKQSGTCLITFIRKRLQTLSNINSFDVISDEKYINLAEDMSLEEIEIELGDFAYEYCNNSTSCVDCNFYHCTAGRCAFDEVKDILTKKIKYP